MEYTITMHRAGYTDYDGFVVLEKTETYTIPFKSGQIVYYANKKKWWKKKSKWVLDRCKVTGVWAGNFGIYGVTLDDDEQIAMCHFDKLFTDREEAIEYCIKKNTHAKVKIYGED